MKTRALLFLLCLAPGTLFGQAVDQATLLHPPPDSWPMYNGRYSADRFSPLKTINDRNVQNLSLAWMARVTGGTPAAAKGNHEVEAIHVGGSPLLVNGVLYFTATDNAWAVDARNGRVLWHYYRESLGDESRTANKGLAIFGSWLYFLTRDNFVVSLDATTGKERWMLPVSDPKQFYYSTMAPMVIGNHLIIGTGGDWLDLSGFLQARDVETGAVQWTTYSTPRAGEPGSDTWPNEYAAIHGGGGPWVQGSYDPDLNLYFYGTANPNPVFAPQARAGANLFTSSIIAINPDTGKMAWHFQTSPHDTHDWDAACSVVMIDGVINGKPRKLVAQASRNGYFFVLDRTNGKNIVSVPFVDTSTWTKGLDAKGQPIPDPDKEPSVGGTLVWPSSGTATNWPPPSFSPQTGLFYVGTDEGYGLFYLSDTDNHPQGWAGILSRVAPSGPASIKAIDYKTGKLAWRHIWPSGGGAVGMLSTQGNLLFTSNLNDLVAFNATNGKVLWHAGLLAAPNAPITYMLDGKQYVFVIAGDTLYSFVLNQSAK
jgi:acido-empty-quinoprotein group A